MNGSVFPALGSQVSVSVAGVGSYLPDHRVSNEEILRYRGRPGLTAGFWSRSGS